MPKAPTISDDEFKQAMRHHDAADERARIAAQEMRSEPRVYIGSGYEFLIVEIPKTLSIMSIRQAEDFCCEMQRLINDAKKIHAHELA